MDVHNLCHFGWDGCIVPTTLKGICSQLPNWRNLKILRAPQVIDGGEVVFPWKFIQNKDGVQCMPCYDKGELWNDGGYAKIYKGRRAVFAPVGYKSAGMVNFVKTVPFQTVCIKDVPLNITPEESAQTPRSKEQSYEDEISAILYEAFLHALVTKTLEREGYASAVPYLYEIVANAGGSQTASSPCAFDSIWIVMEFLQGHTLEKFLYRSFIPVNTTGRPLTSLQRSLQQKNDSLLLDVLVQLAFYLHVLQGALMFNHRDMKINNLFIRHHAPEERWGRTLTIPEIGTWTCISDMVLIDFGFACIACGSDGSLPNPRATLVGAGSWFKIEHDCFKKGRDLAQFLYSLHCSFPLNDYISADLFAVIHSALEAKKGAAGAAESIDLMRGLAPDGAPLPAPAGTPLPRSIDYNNGIYYFLRDGDVDVPGCEPLAFLRALAALRTPRKN